MDGWRTRDALSGWFGNVPCRLRLAPRGASLCVGVGFLIYPTVSKGTNPLNDRA